MLKRRMLAILAALIVTIAATGAIGVIGDTFGLSVTTPSHACDQNGGTGGC